MCDIKNKRTHFPDCGLIYYLFHVGLSSGLYILNSDVTYVHFQERRLCIIFIFKYIS